MKLWPLSHPSWASQKDFNPDLSFAVFHADSAAHDDTSGHDSRCRVAVRPASWGLARPIRRSITRHSSMQVVSQKCLQSPHPDSAPQNQISPQLVLSVSESLAHNHLHNKWAWQKSWESLPFLRCQNPKGQETKLLLEELQRRSLSHWISVHCSQLEWTVSRDNCG